MKKQAGTTLVPYRDDQSRTCLLIQPDTDPLFARFIPMSIEGFAVHALHPRDFHAQYKPLQNYPAERAARLYLAYAQELGATDEALGYLGQVITISKQEYDMATAKKNARANAGETAPKTKAVKAEKAAPIAKPAKAEKPAKAAPTKPAKAPKPKKDDAAPRETAAAMFQQLLMEGKNGVCIHTDEQIFAKVKAKFGLDDSKRSYVKWYRNSLTKKGEKVPAAKS